MKIDSAIAILKTHQLWRRGLPPYNEIGVQPSYTGTELGQAIDIAINELEKNK